MFIGVVRYFENIINVSGENENMINANTKKPSPIPIFQKKYISIHNHSCEAHIGREVHIGRKT